jgi:hypothetical protein
MEPAAHLANAEHGSAGKPELESGDEALCAVTRF